MKCARIVGIAFVGAALALIGCSGSKDMGSSEKATLASESSAALDGFKNEDPSLQELINKSVGYAVFPDVGKAGFIAGGSYGKGEVFEGGMKIGHADISQATIGLQAGAQSFSELILFLKPEELAKFKHNEFEFAANLSAIALKAGAAKSADTSKGVIVFVHAKGGLMAEASIGGQRFRYNALTAK